MVTWKYPEVLCEIIIGQCQSAVEKGLFIKDVVANLMSDWHTGHEN